MLVQLFRGDLTFEEAWNMPRRELLMLAEARNKSLSERPEAALDRDLSKAMR